MSLLQELQWTRHIVGEEKSRLLEQYFEQTGADLGKTLYTIEGWELFEKWEREQSKEMIIADIQEVESKFRPRVRVYFKESNDPRGWRSVETTKMALFRKIKELGEDCLTKEAKKQYEKLK